MVYRFDPAVDNEPRYEEFTIEAEATDKILDCLNKIRWEQDATLSYRYSCAHGICGSDALMINGRIGLACQKLVRDFKTANNSRSSRTWWWTLIHSSRSTVPCGPT
jgi:succinate dehydrogenase / fumarate reductase iron-sulfur subunit